MSEGGTERGKDDGKKYLHTLVGVRTQKHSTKRHF